MFQTLNAYYDMLQRLTTFTSNIKQNKCLLVRKQTVERLHANLRSFLYNCWYIALGRAGVNQALTMQLANGERIVGVNT